MQMLSRIAKSTLQLGDRGRTVQELQQLLDHYVRPKGPDPIDCYSGIFDDSTRQGVLAFQQQFFLYPDGIVGQKTWQVLYSSRPIDRALLQQGNAGEQVLQLQHVLAGLGYYTAAIDGEFGSQTKAAVCAFQLQHQLLPDGLVTERVWCALSRAPRCNA